MLVNSLLMQEMWLNFKNEEKKELNCLKNFQKKLADVKS